MVRISIDIFLRNADFGKEIYQDFKSDWYKKDSIININSLENEGDQLIRNGFKTLFANHKKPVLIIKWMDIFKNMEEIIDECENTGYIVEDIIVKNF